MDLEVVSKLVNRHVKGAIISSGSAIVETLKPYVDCNLKYAESIDNDKMRAIKEGCEALINDKFIPEEHQFNISDLINPNFAKMIYENNLGINTNEVDANTEFETKLSEIVDDPSNIREVISNCRRFETKVALILSTINKDTIDIFLREASVDSDLAYTFMAINNPGFVRQPNPRVGDYNLFITNGVDTVAVKIESPFTSDLLPVHFMALSKVCNICLLPSTKVCLCKKAKYCSRDCQQVHRVIHKQYCII